MYIFKYLTPLFACALLSQPIPAQTAHGDCNTALIVCNKASIAVDALPDAGNDAAEVTTASCLNKPFPESNAIWLKWKIDEGGALGFTLLPAVQSDDLDFILYRVDGTPDCAGRTELRCMVSGKILGETAAEATSCTGATGLSKTASDISESSGCKSTNDNFLSLVKALPGETYLLFVNNYHSANGFLLEFSGDCTFSEIPGDCLTSAAGSNAPDVHSTDNALRFSNVYPNPASSEINLDVAAANDMEGRLELIDIHGQIVRTRRISVLAGNNTLNAPVGDLPAGVWFVKISCGGSSCLSRFYKG